MLVVGSSRHDLRPPAEAGSPSADAGGSATSRRSVSTIAVGATPPDKRDALLALVLAEIGRANDIAERSDRVLQQVLKSRSWRFTRLFRALGRAVGRLLQSPVRLSGRS